MHLMEPKKPLLHLLLLLLPFTYLLSLGAVPVSRSLASRSQELPIIKIADQVVKPSMEEEFVRGRMDIESNDYAGSGANNRHDPRTPGRG